MKSALITKPSIFTLKGEKETFLKINCKKKVLKEKKNNLTASLNLISHHQKCL